LKNVCKLAIIYNVILRYTKRLPSIRTIKKPSEPTEGFFYVKTEVDATTLSEYPEHESNHKLVDAALV